MKISHQKISKKTISIVSIIVLCLVIASVAAAYHYRLGPFKNNTPSSSTNLSPATDEQKQSGNTIKQDSATNQNTKQGVGGSDQPPAPTPQQGSSKSKVDMTITAANQNGSTLQIRTLISTLTSTGTCVLTLTSPSGSLVTKSSGVQPQSNTSTCKGFDVSTSELSSGNWKATVTYDSDTLTGSASTTVLIKV